MALTTIISRKELQRIAELAYEGETLKVMLCVSGATDLTEESTVADWQAEEVSGNGYVRFSEVIGTGQYDESEGRYELPVIDAEFTASGVGYTYDTVVLYIDGATHVHSILTEEPNIVLLPGQTQAYRLTLAQDD